MSGEPARDKLTLWQRSLLRRTRRAARKGKAEPLSPEDWQLVWQLSDTRAARAVKGVWRTLPSRPRCGMCSAPFAGPGRFVARPLGYRPSRKNPTLCATCVELSPPGGMTTYTGVLFADVRGFTSQTEASEGAQMANLLRRFYGAAERVLFPEAIIDKVVGDEVMAIYLPDVHHTMAREDVPSLMLRHATELLEAVGYGSPDGPFVDIGIGLDVGEAFVGNIGERAIFDFTAVGDVVNTASRLQGAAAAGEIVLSARLAKGLPAPVGVLETLRLKGKKAPTRAYRVS